MDEIDRIISYEQGDLTEQETIDLFQKLLDDDVVFKLQGHYGRMATYLLENNLIQQKGVECGADINK